MNRFVLMVENFRTAYMNEKVRAMQRYITLMKMLAWAQRRSRGWSQIRNVNLSQKGNQKIAQYR
jgi:hypothetical protein